MVWRKASNVNNIRVAAALQFNIAIREDLKDRERPGCIGRGRNLWIFAFFVGLEKDEDFVPDLVFVLHLLPIFFCFVLAQSAFRRSQSTIMFWRKSMLQPKVSCAGK